MPIDAGFFVGLLGFSSALICLVHLGRARLTLAPIYAVAGVFVLLLWHIRELGWWVDWDGLQIDAALVGLLPPLLAGMILVYAMDGIRAARAYLLILVTTSAIGWGFASLRDALAAHVPIPYAFVLSTQSNLGVLIGSATGGLTAVLAYEALRRPALPVAMPVAVYAALGGYLIPASIIEYGALVGWANIRAQTPEFAPFGSFPALLLLAYGLFARRTRGLMPPRPLTEVFSFWRSTESNLRASREDVLEGRRTISELNQLNRALEESERINEYQVMHSPLGVIYTDLRGLIEFANPAALALLRTTTQQLAGEPITELFVSSQSLDLRQLAQSDDAPALKLRQPDGTAIWCELTAMQRLGTGGKRVGFHLLLKDVTTRHEAQRLQIIEQRVKGIHETGRVLVHDFSNLLLGMQGRLADLDLAFTEHQAGAFREGLDTLKQGIKRGRELLRQLGAGEAFSRPRLDTVDLGSILAEAENVCRPSAREHGITIYAHPYEALLVKADPAQITRVCTNLIMNAIRATPRGGRIDLSVAVDGEGGQVEIRDSGPGLSEAQMEQAFEPGFSSKGAGQGGLGLAIAYLMVDAHAGRLQLGPNEPHGLCASARLRQAPADPALPARCGPHGGCVGGARCIGAGDAGRGPFRRRTRGSDGRRNLGRVAHRCHAAHAVGSARRRGAGLHPGARPVPSGACGGHGGSGSRTADPASRLAYAGISTTPFSNLEAGNSVRGFARPIDVHRFHLLAFSIGSELPPSAIDGSIKQITSQFSKTV